MGEVAPAYYPRIVHEIRDGGLTNAELGSITGVRERQVTNWAAGTHQPAGQKRARLLELHYIVEQLKDVYSPDGVQIWLHGRNRSLEGRRPIDLLREGEFEVVLHAIDRLKTGAAP